MINMIAAVSNNAIIGLEGILPWQGKYTEDMKFFREKTKGATVIMGRATYQSIGKALPKRRNIVISSISKQEGLLANEADIEVFNSLPAALETCSEDVWLIGGESIYTEGMKHADNIYLTLIPEFVDIQYKKHAKFPFVNPKLFPKQSSQMISDVLEVITYSKN